MLAKNVNAGNSYLSGSSGGLIFMVREYTAEEDKCFGISSEGRIYVPMCPKRRQIMIF